jgi:rhodanese-related sulfurtransferase
MYLIAIFAAACCALIFGLVRVKRLRKQRELEGHSIDAEALHSLLEAESGVLLFDVRQPLDLLAQSEMIPGATRVAPKELLRDVTLIPREADTVIYCTCPSEKTSRSILEKAKALHFSNIRILRGGLEAWKAKGFPVVPYQEAFRLDTAR